MTLRIPAPAKIKFASSVQAGIYSSEFSDPYFTSEYADELFASVDVYAAAVDLESSAEIESYDDTYSVPSDSTYETESSTDPIYTSGEINESAINELAEQVAAVALNGESETDDSSSQDSLAVEFQDSTQSGSLDSQTGTATSIADSTSADSTATAEEAEPAEDPRKIAIPGELDLSVPQLPTENSLSSLSTYAPPETFSFTTSVETTAPTVVTVIAGEKTGDKVSAGNSTVVRDLVWVTPSDWTLTESRVTTWTTIETTTDADGVEFVESESGSTSLTIMVSADGSFSLTSNESKILDYSSNEEWDESTVTPPSDPVDPTIVDKGTFNGSVVNSLSRSVSISSTPVVLPDGRLGSETSLGLSSITSSILGIGGKSDYSKSTGSLVPLIDPSLPVIPGGNGRLSQSKAALAIDASRAGSFGLSVRATVADGEQITPADITGTVSVGGANSLGASASSGFGFDDQSYSGNATDETDEHLYVSFSLNDRVGFGVSAGIMATVDVQDPTSATSVEYEEFVSPEPALDDDDVTDVDADDVAAAVVSGAAADTGATESSGDGGSTSIEFVEIPDDPEPGISVRTGGGMGAGGGGKLTIQSRTRSSDISTGYVWNVLGQHTFDSVETVTLTVSGSSSSSGGYQVTADSATGDQVLETSVSATTSGSQALSVESKQTHVPTATGYFDFDLGFPGPATVELITIYHDLEKTSYSSDGTDITVAAISLD